MSQQQKQDIAPRGGRLRSHDFKRERRPEIFAGGFARDDSTMDFLVRLNALLRPDMTVIDLGAGRGSAFKGEETYKHRLAKIQGKVRRVIGIDVDDAINLHPYLDERHVVAIDEPYPVETGSIDLVVSDWVLEHVANPSIFAPEIARVLKPGGWFLARTPNRRGYVGIGARLLPNALHKTVLAKVSPGRHEEDMFPTVYRMNTERALKRYFPPSSWDHFTYAINPTPQYHANSRILFGLIGLYQNLMPSSFRTDLIVVLRKRGETPQVATSARA